MGLINNHYMRIIEYTDSKFIPPERKSMISLKFRSTVVNKNNFNDMKSKFIFSQLTVNQIDNLF
jgi:hypothetical protein